MVLLLYLWETLKKWTSREEMRRGGGEGEGNLHFKTTFPSPFQQVVGGRRLECGVRYYPEGGWGWIVCACAFLAHVTTSGCQFSGGALHVVLPSKIKEHAAEGGRWLGPFSWSVSCLSAPFVVNVCRRRKARLLSIVGGCLFPLSLFLTSFVTEIHHIFFSFGILGGIGSCLVRESSNVVLGHYFRRRRQFVEQVVLAGTGVGLTLFSLLFLSLGRHVGWEEGFQMGGGISLITAILPLFYRTVNQQPQKRTMTHQIKAHEKVLMPVGGDFCQSLRLFCVPQIKPLLWATAVGSSGLLLPLFLLLEITRSEGLSGGSLLLLQTHLGLGLSLGVILGAVFTLKRNSRCCNPSPQSRTIITTILTGISVFAIAICEGYYAYSLAAWAYGTALGSHLYTLKILAMEKTRTKHWERVWGLLQGIMATPLLFAIGVFTFFGKESFYAAAAALIISAGILGFQLLNINNCSSPELSSEDNESPIPPPPPPPPHQQPIRNRPPLRRSLSLNQPPISYYGPHPYCRECIPPFHTPNIFRSQSLPQPPTQAHQQIPGPSTSTGRGGHQRSLSNTQIQSHAPASTSTKIHFADTQPQEQSQRRAQDERRGNIIGKKGSSERFPDLPIEPQFFPILQIPLQQQEPAFTRHYVDSSLFQQKVSRQDFNVEQPQFNSLRRPPKPQERGIERRGSGSFQREAHLHSEYFFIQNSFH